MKKATIAFVALAAAGAAMWLLMTNSPTPPDAEAAPAADVHAYIASEDFAELTVEQQSGYLEKLWKQSPGRMRELMKIDHLPEDTRRRVVRNVRQGMIRLMTKQARELEALSPEEQDGYLDARIDEMMQKMTGAVGKGVIPGRGGPPWRRGDVSGDQIQKHIEQMLSCTSPSERAHLYEYRRRLVSRLRQRMGLRQ